MREKVREVAERIRGLREIAGRTPAETARRIGVPESEYARYEDGSADIPLGALFEIAALHGVELSSLITGGNPHLHVYSLVRAGEGPAVDRRRGYRYEGLAANFAHKRAEPFLVTVDPAPAGAPARLNAHPGQEFTHVLSGELKVTVGAHELVLRPGDSLYFDATQGHGMAALGGVPARFLAVIL